MDGCLVALLFKKGTSLACLAKTSCLSVLFCFLTVISVTGCSDSIKDYKQAVSNGIKTVPHVQEIKKMFPGCPTDHFITQYGFDKSKPVLWNTVVYFGGSYEFTYQAQVKVDYKTQRIVSIPTTAKFHLWHISRIYGDIDTPSSDIDQDVTLKESDWEKVVAAKGNFSVIGVTLKTNQPTPRFDEFVRAWRRDRMQVDN